MTTVKLVLTSFMLLIIPSNSIASNDYEVIRYCMNFVEYEQCKKEFNIDTNKDGLYDRYKKKSGPTRIPIIPYKQ